MDLIRDHLITLDGTVTQTTAALQHSNFTFYMMDRLVAAGIGQWSCIASARPGVATAAQNWTSGAHVTRNTPGNAHSWTLLQNSEGVQMLLDACYASTEQLRVVWARPDDQFSLSGLSDLNAPANPTSAIERVTATFLQNTVLANHRAHVWRDELGSFVVGFGQSGTGILHSAFYMFRLTTSIVAALGVEAMEADLSVYPYLTGAHHNTVGRGAFDGATFSNNNAVYNSMWDSSGVPIPGFIDVRNAMSTMGPGGTVTGAYPSARFEIYTNSTEVAFRGVVPDWRMLPGAPSSNNRDGTGDPFEQISIGNVDAITNGTATLTL